MSGYSPVEWMAASLSAGWIWVDDSVEAAEILTENTKIQSFVNIAPGASFLDDGAKAMIELELEYESGENMELPMPLWSWPVQGPHPRHAGVGR